MSSHHIPAKAVTLAHRLHKLVHRAEAVCHCGYLGLVAGGYHEYHYAAGLMLGTVIVGAVLHGVIAFAGEVE